METEGKMVVLEGDGLLEPANQNGVALLIVIFFAINKEIQCQQFSDLWCF